MADDQESELLAYLSHEVRTGLHAMGGHAQLLRLGALPREDAASVERIIDTGFYLVGLLEEVAELAASELKAEQLVGCARIDADPLLQQLVSVVGPLASARGARLELEPVPSDAARVKADRRRL